MNVLLYISRFADIFVIYHPSFAYSNIIPTYKLLNYYYMHNTSKYYTIKRDSFISKTKLLLSIFHLNLTIQFVY